MPINENAAVKSAMSPYKIPNWEEVIADVVKVSGVTAILLRYFKPIGHTVNRNRDYRWGTTKSSAIYNANRNGLERRTFGLRR
jgi:UDP-glucose 4-epimerase